MKKIAVDLRCLETPTGQRGIGYYNKHLFKEILKLPHLKIQYDLLNFKKVPALYWPKKGLRRLDPFFSLIWSYSLNKIKPDLLHIPFLFEIYYLSVPDHIKTVVTLYDIIPLLFPKEYFQNQRAQDWYMMRLNQAKKAAKIITISKSSKKDIQKFLNIDEEKITVIYGGVDDRFKIIDKQKAKEFLEKKYKITGKFILTVSTHSFHKNIQRIFQAFSQYLKNIDHSLKLVVVCKLTSFEEKDWRKQINNLGLDQKVILTNFVSDEDLVYFYNASELFLFPSLYEGLGLPILEAFSCGTPVITSNVSSLSEVGGSAVLYVDPLDIKNMTNAVGKVLNDEELKQNLIIKGFNQVKKFSWEKAAEQTVKVYQEALNSH